ncbi:hypothetical protein L602_000900000690 [Cupriavidus gilardii J11]|uniref:Uncharacterized protein n=1 Tax=Cupriavidus gilardii J11 TaxID=936133 RepID=A0A562B0Q6_9BURK|nr:hypothetical protein L602_000900000690 [Cupriavidus gilardii J11]
MQAVLEAHDAHADRTVAQVRIARLVHRVVVDVDHVVEHPHRGADGLLELGVVEHMAAVGLLLQVGNKVHRTQVAHRDLALIGVQRDLGAQVRAVHHADMLLRAADVARILERDPRMAGLEQHAQHLAPQLHRRDLLEQLQFAARDLLFIAEVGLLEFLADLVVQVRAGGRREQRPFAVFHHALHEQVRNPVRGVHVVRAAAVVAGVLAQLEEFLDVQVPRLQVGAHRALALAALVHRHGGVVDDLQERHHALRLAVGPLDVRAQRAHVGPVVAQAAGELRQQRVFLQALVDAFEVVRNGGQVARRQLRAAGARVEQRRRRRHEVERRQQVVELDGPAFAVGLVQRQPHRHAHEERLRHLDAGFIDMQEIAVVQRLQAQVVELEVARGVQRRAQARQVEGGQLLVE